MSELGVNVGPPLDISISEEYDLSQVHVLSWLYHLIEEGRLLAIALEPPCTTFSIMRRPALRSKRVPLGFNTRDPKTRLGNLLFLRALQLLKKAVLHRMAGLLERPFSALSKFLPSYQASLRWPGVQEVRIDSCQYGSIHQKSFAFLVANVDMKSITRRCQGKCEHVPIAGVYTKASAIYTPELAAALAWALRHAIKVIKLQREEEDGLRVAGLENQFVNEVMLSNSWEVKKSWKFKKPSHINLLELRAVERLVEDRAMAGPSRFVNFVDSNVTRCALGKGRSASLALSAVLRRISAVLVAFGLYMVTPFCPTRLNCADDPTRDRTLRPPVPGFGWHHLSYSEVWKIACITPTRRWVSNWIRLLLFLVGPRLTEFKDRAVFRHQIPRRGVFQMQATCDLPCPDFVYAHREFDSTLGYPGEGHRYAPHPDNCLTSWQHPGIVCSSGSHLHPGSFVSSLWPTSLLRRLWLGISRLLRLPSWTLLFIAWVLAGVGPIGCDAMHPSTAADFLRAAERSAAEPLREGRPTLPITGRLRDRYWTQFEQWLLVEGIDFERLLLHHVECIDDINAVMSRFGKALYNAGKPYNQFAETLNALTTKKPAIRRLLQGAWDVAFSWLHAEPGSHHIAMPWQVLLAMISLSLAWGRTLFAGSLALSWGALLRPGELFASSRADLLLPKEVDFTIACGLLAIKEPKTRRTGARHQAAKLDVPDLLEVVNFCFGNLPPSAKLWPWSGQTFRTRFRDVLTALKLPTQKLGDMKALDPGSLRSGGATWHLQTTEDGEYTRRKERWLSAKIMEIYVQESASLLYLKKIPPSSKELVLTFAHVFPVVFATVQRFLRLGIVPTAWYPLLLKEDLECMGRSGVV